MTQQKKVMYVYYKVYQLHTRVGLSTVLNTGPKLTRSLQKKKNNLTYI